MGSKRTTAAVLGLVLGLASAGVRADDPAPAKVENPLFAAWSKCDVGATCSYEADLPGPNGTTVHLTDTDTLKEKTDDGVKIESKAAAGEHDLPVDTKTFPAKVEASEVKKTGDEEVKVGDKTYKCKIYELGPTVGGDEKGPTMTVDVCDEVPGGIVKAVVKGPDGQEMTIKMTEFKAK